MKAKQERDLRALKGKYVYAYRKDGTVISGKLVKTQKNGYAIRVNRKDASTKALIPLVLFDLLAIGTQPYGYGYGPGPGYGHGYGYGYEYPPYPVYGGYYPYGYGPDYFD